MNVASGQITGVHHLLDERAKRDPSTTAVVCGRTRLTYAELATRSDGLAARLVQHGVRPDGLVGLLVERGVDMVVALFAILKSGGAYVPLDPDHPAALYHQGTGLARQRQFDQAVQVWERVIELDPDGPFAAEARSRARSARDLQHIFAGAS